MTLAGGFIYEPIATQEEVRAHIQECESRHVQQVAYSSFHDSLTQVCFGCGVVRSNLGQSRERTSKKGT